jgi:hypothetical protein
MSLEEPEIREPAATKDGGSDEQREKDKKSYGGNLSLLSFSSRAVR